MIDNGHRHVRALTHIAALTPMSALNIARHMRAGLPRLRFRHVRPLIPEQHGQQTTHSRAGRSLSYTRRMLHVDAQLRPVGNSIVMSGLDGLVTSTVMSNGTIHQSCARSASVPPRPSDFQ